MGVRDSNWTRPNIRVGDIWVCALASWKCLGTYVFVGYMCILSPTVEKSIVYLLLNEQERNSFRLNVCPLSNGR